MMLADEARIGVIGAGAWGTALAVLANRVGNDVCLWTRNENVLHSVSTTRMNAHYLPDIYIDPSISMTSELADVCQRDVVIIAIPSHSLRATCIAISDMIASETPIILATKGIERGSLLLMSEIVSGILPGNPLLVLSGPNFAREAASGKPTAASLACTQTRLAEKIAQLIGGRYFRPYVTDDMMGVQIGGAVKNIIAIACGIAIGYGMGENARAALITRGLVEMRRLTRAKGGREETLMGLSGLGDLVLTCGSLQSRNMSLGHAIGSGRMPADLLESNAVGLTEGVITAEAVAQMSAHHGIAMPICVAVHEVLKKGKKLDEAILTLLDRPITFE